MIVNNKTNKSINLFVKKSGVFYYWVFIRVESEERVQMAGCSEFISDTTAICDFYNVNCVKMN